MAVESALSVVVLSACFSLIFWNALIHRKLTRLRRSYYTAWFYFPDMPYVSAALQTAWLAASGYLLWSGSEPYAPAELLDSFNGQMYTAAFTLFFLFIGVESLLNQHLERLNATNELKFFTFVDFALWVIVFVIGFIDGTIWSATWPAARIIGFVLILSYPFAVPWAPFISLSLYIKPETGNATSFDPVPVEAPSGTTLNRRQGFDF